MLPVLLSAMERLGEEAAKAADEQIAEMRSTFESAQSTLSRERDAAVKVTHDSRIELSVRADQVKDLRESIKRLRAEITDEKKRRDRSEAARRKLDDQAHALEATLSRLNEARDRLEQSLTERTDALAQLSAAHDTLKTEVAALTATNTSLEARLADSQNTLNALIAKIDNEGPGES